MSDVIYNKINNVESNCIMLPCCTDNCKDNFSIAYLDNTENIVLTSLNSCDTVQSLYDITNVKNGSGFEQLSTIIADSKTVKIVADKKFWSQCVLFGNQLERIGIRTFCSQLKNDFTLDNVDILFIVTENADTYKYLMDDLEESDCKIIFIVPDHTNLTKFRFDLVIKFLKNTVFDELLCVNVAFNCINLNLMLKFGLLKEN